MLLLDETPLRIAVGETVSLEARSTTAPGGAVGVVCHPHPEFGGSMDNNVVLAACQVLGELGLGALRFNFRGVGGSTGEHGGGSAEVADVAAACAHARAESGGAAPHLLGYSFGSRVALMALQGDLDVASAVLVAPPVDVFDFGALALAAVPCLIVVGDSDGFCSVPRLRHWLADQAGPPPELVVLPAVDHFYLGREAELQATIRRFLTTLTPEASAPRP
ncbi:MAG: alpha/beta hydrolase [Deltaproteobacteria bacterium]|nr:alpha/beta hydrolase [Deltaproteobacteria bacterium]